MKKIFVILFFILMFASTATADEFGTTGDLWDNFNSSAPNQSEQQKAVSDDKFNSIVDKLKSKRKKQPKPMKGESIQQSNETEQINQTAEELPVVCISIPLKVNEDGILPVGHYQVKGELVEGQPRLKLYQGHFLMADFPATETSDDFNEPEINFVKLTDYKDNQLRIIFGSVDFNAFAVVEAAE